MELAKVNLTGALVAVSLYILCILIFLLRLTNHKTAEYWTGIVFLLAVIPLCWLLFTAPGLERPVLYYIQAGLMITFILAEFLLDYVFKYDFRHVRWMVITYVTLYFASTGGMIGIASLAGRFWTILSVILFLIMAGLAFYQRAKTGM